MKNQMAKDPWRENIVKFQPFCFELAMLLEKYPDALKILEDSPEVVELLAKWHDELDL
jgi:hypothetical protein